MLAMIAFEEAVEIDIERRGQAVMPTIMWIRVGKMHMKELQIPSGISKTSRKRCRSEVRKRRM